MSIDSRLIIDSSDFISDPRPEDGSWVSACREFVIRSRVQELLGLLGNDLCLLPASRSVVQATTQLAIPAELTRKKGPLAGTTRGIRGVLAGIPEVEQVGETTASIVPPKFRIDFDNGLYTEVAINSQEKDDTSKLLRLCPDVALRIRQLVFLPTAEEHLRQMHHTWPGGLGVFQDSVVVPRSSGDPLVANVSYSQRSIPLRRDFLGVFDEDEYSHLHREAWRLNLSAEDRDIYTPEEAKVAPIQVAAIRGARPVSSLWLLSEQLLRDMFEETVTLSAAEAHDHASFDPMRQEHVSRIHSTLARSVGRWIRSMWVPVYRLSNGIAPDALIQAPMGNYACVAANSDWLDKETCEYEARMQAFFACERLAREHRRQDSDQYPNALFSWFKESGFPMRPRRARMTASLKAALDKAKQADRDHASPS